MVADDFAPGGREQLVDVLMGLSPAQIVRAIRAAHEAVAGHDRAEGRPLFTSILDLTQRPPMQNWLVSDYLENNSAALLFGESATAKSFAVIDMACSIATGRDWCGHKVLQGPVFYVCGEGHGGMAKRFKAWQTKHGTDLAGAPIFISTRPVVLPDDGELQRLTDWIDGSGHVPRLVVFDTLARSLSGDENSSRDVGAFVQAIDALRIIYGCCVLVVHHSGHSTAERARGSSALKAAMDTEACMSMQDDVRKLSVTKQKNHEPPAPKVFTLESVALPWVDDEGHTMYSAVLVEAEGVELGTKRDKRRLSRQEDAVLNALNLAIDDQGEAPSATIKERFSEFAGGAHRDRKVASLEAWRERAYPVLDTDGDKATGAKRQGFHRARRKLRDLGLVQTMDEFWWPVRDRDMA